MAFSIRASSSHGLPSRRLISPSFLVSLARSSTSRELVLSVDSGKSGSPSIHSQPMCLSCWQNGFSTTSYSHWITLIGQLSLPWSPAWVQERVVLLRAWAVVGRCGAAGPGVAAILASWPRHEGGPSTPLPGQLPECSPIANGYGGQVPLSDVRRRLVRPFWPRQGLRLPSPRARSPDKWSIPSWIQLPVRVAQPGRPSSAGP